MTGISQPTQQRIRRPSAKPVRSLTPSLPNTADQLRSGAPVNLASGGTGRHLSLPYGCRPELRQLHPLVRPRGFAGLQSLTQPSAEDTPPKRTYVLHRVHVMPPGSADATGMPLQSVAGNQMTPATAALMQFRSRASGSPAKSTERT
jgi:hypothetical protein